MAGDTFAMSSRTAQEQRIAANWLHRLRRCLKPEQADLFRSATLAAGISQADIDQAQQITQAQLDKVTRFVRREVPDITLLMFAEVEVLDLGLTGYAATNSGSIGRALDILYQYHSLTSDRYIDHLEVQGEEAVITTSPLLGHLQDMQNIVEDSFTGNYSALRRLLGPAYDPARVKLNFQHAAPDYVATYESVFAGARIKFSCTSSELRFPADWLKCPVDHAMQGMEDVYTAMCERVLGPGDGVNDTAQRVRRLLLSRPGRRMYRLEEAAASLRLSTTQLRKRLYRKNTSYKALVLEIRMELAKHYLLDTRLTLQEIAYLLDYSQAAPLSRAFKSYFGVSPERFRQMQGIQLGSHL
jgi:AraC-like DNA-binding protein